MGECGKFRKRLDCATSSSVARLVFLFLALSFIDLVLASFTSSAAFVVRVQTSSPQQRLFTMVQSTDKRLEELGISLPPPAKAAANYVPACPAGGNILYLSGHLPFQDDGTLLTGKIGSGGETVEYGYKAARQVGLNLLATLKKELDGDLDRIERVVKLTGFVQSTDDFHEQHKVINGCSDVLNEVLQDRGVHARSAIGTNALPLDIAVEIEAIVQIKP